MDELTAKNEELITGVNQSVQDIDAKIEKNESKLTTLSDKVSQNTNLIEENEKPKKFDRKTVRGSNSWKHQLRKSVRGSDSWKPQLRN